MKRLFLALALLCVASGAARAQSAPSPPFVGGQIPTATQLNNAFIAKRDFNTAATSIPIVGATQPTSITCGATYSATTALIFTLPSALSSGPNCSYTVIAQSGGVTIGLASATDALNGTVGGSASLFIGSAAIFTTDGVANWRYYSTSASLAVGSTAISGGAGGELLYNAAGVLGNEPVSALSFSGSQITGGTVGAAYLPTGSNSALGALRCDGTTTSCSGGAITSIGGAATAVTVGTTTVDGGTSGYYLYDSGGALGAQPLPTGSGSQQGILECGTGVTCSGGVISTGAGTGNVIGPSSSTTHDLASYADATGKTLEDSASATIGTAAPVSLSSATASTSTTTGALVVAGGEGIGGAVYIGGNLTVGGSFTATAPNESANTFYAGPASGSAAPASFRGLVTADLATVSIATSGTLGTSATTNSTSSSTGALTTAGGLGVAKSTFLGSCLVVGAPTGGCEGTGSVNATGYYLNGVAIGGSTITVGTTAVAGGTSPYLLYNNGGTLGNESLASLLASPPGIGETTPGTGSFTTLGVAGLLSTAATTSSGAGLNLPQGTAPSSPNNGDVWMTSSGLYYRANGATAGPLGASGMTISGSNATSAALGNILTAAGAPVSAAYGGTGINNGSSTLTLANSVSFAAAPSSTSCVQETSAGAFQPTGTLCGSGSGTAGAHAQYSLTTAYTVPSTSPSYDVVFGGAITPARSGVVLAVLGGSYALPTGYDGYYKLAYGTSSVAQGGACPSTTVSTPVTVNDQLGNGIVAADAATAVITGLTISTTYYVYMCATGSSASVFTAEPSDLSLVEQ